MRALIIALVLALASLAGVGWLYKAQVERATALSTQLEILTEAQNQAAVRAGKDRKALVARQAKIALQARNLAQAEQALAEALERNKSWSDTDVPLDVQTRLAGPISALGGLRPEAVSGPPVPPAPGRVRDE